MEDFGSTLLKVAIEAILVSGILGFFFIKREETLKRKVGEEFRKRERFFDVRLNYKRQSLEELLAPLLMQLERSKSTLYKYRGDDGYKEAILKQCNETTRDLILSKSFLIPSDLMNEAAKLLSHYDGWLQYYHEIREVEKNMEKPFVFTGDFPKNAEKRFKEKYEEYRTELFNDDKRKD